MVPLLLIVIVCGVIDDDLTTISKAVGGVFVFQRLL